MSDNEPVNTSSDAQASSPDTSDTSARPYMGRVKWFNNRAGYGFVTVLNNDKKGKDVFVHHSGVKVDHEQYRYLVQGEYVSFRTSRSDSKDHKWQATDVRGILGEKLMCETHWDMRKEREERARTTGVEPTYRGRRDNPRRDNQHRDNQRRGRPQRYGGGPREDADGFTLAHNGRPPKDSSSPAAEEIRAD